MRLEHGLVQVYTGEGKGKTTAGVGQAVRAVGRGLAVCFVQFVKGGERSGELEPLERLGVRVVRPAERSTGLLSSGGVTPEDRAAAEEAWLAAEDALRGGEYDLVVLDEVNVALAAGLGEVSRLLAALAIRPRHVEVVCTGRGAPQELIDAADYVTEMCARKHPFDSGLRARRGIEF